MWLRNCRMWQSLYCQKVILQSAVNNLNKLCVSSCIQHAPEYNTHVVLERQNEVKKIFPELGLHGAWTKFSLQMAPPAFPA